jgi:hypothetical protein
MSREVDAVSPARLTRLTEIGAGLWIAWGYASLPIGFIVLAVGLTRQGAVPKWQGICMVAGLLFLLNPDIEIINSARALLMCLGFIPWGGVWPHLADEPPDLQDTVARPA